MKALVTGGGGFLGRYIVEKLLNRGDKVVTFSRSEYPELREIGAETIIGDITHKEAVMAVCEGVDAVFHVASNVGIWGAWKDFYSTNVMGTKNVIAGCKKHGVKKLVYTSSPSVVFDGKPHEGIDETYPYPSKYLAFYPQTKAMAEREVLKINGTGLLTCSLRPHLVWGPRDTNLIPRLLRRADAGRLKIVGDGENLIDTVYVENAADAHLLALDRLRAGSPVAGQASFITQGEPVKIWDFVNAILEGLGKPAIARKISFTKAYRAGAVMELSYKLARIRSEPPMTRFLALQLAMPHYFNISKARNELGYTPNVTTEEGLEKLFEYMKGESM